MQKHISDNIEISKYNIKIDKNLKIDNNKMAINASRETTGVL